METEMTMVLAMALAMARMAVGKEQQNQVT